MSDSRRDQKLGGSSTPKFIEKYRLQHFEITDDKYKFSTQYDSLEWKRTQTCDVRDMATF